MSINTAASGREAERAAGHSAGVVDVTGLSLAELESFVAGREEGVGVHRRGGRTFVVVE